MSQDTKEIIPMMDSQAEQLPAVIEQLNRAEVDISIATAKKYPRDVKASINYAQTLATHNPAIAAEMSYAIKRDGKVISGPSIRLAEIMAHAWGNMIAGSRIIEIGDEFVTAQGVCHDLETNVRITKEVKRRIVNKKGARFNLDMIQTTANAASSIALRDAMFRVIPKSFVEPIRESARLVAAGDQVDLPTRRAKAIAHFQHYGVDEARILAALEVSQLEDIGPKQIVTLLEFATAIKDGESTIEGVFPVTSKTETVLKGGSGAGKTTKPPASAAPSMPNMPVTPASPEDFTQLSDQMQQLQSDVAECGSEQLLASMHAEWANDPGVDPASQLLITKWVQARRKEGF